MNQDTEKALLEYVAAHAAYFESVGVDSTATGAEITGRCLKARFAARAYLATLEHQCTCPNRIGNQVDPHCSVHREPEPKRGVDDTLGVSALIREAFDIAGHGHSPMEIAMIRRRLADAERLYREERERVERVAAGIRSRISGPLPEVCTGCISCRTARKWADELEGR